MAIPVSLLWSQWKNVVFLGLLGLSFLAGWEMKSRSIVKQFAKEESKAVVAAERKGEKAVATQVENTKKLSQLEKENEDLRNRLKSLPDRSVCVPSADELQLLEELQKGTERK